MEVDEPRGFALLFDVVMRCEAISLLGSRYRSRLLCDQGLSVCPLTEQINLVPPLRFMRLCAMQGSRRILS
jgi:hypothetical protein